MAGGLVRKVRVKRVGDGQGTFLVEEEHSSKEAWRGRETAFKNNLLSLDRARQRVGLHFAGWS